jgi:hypothetical protein
MTEDGVEQPRCAFCGSTKDQSALMKSQRANSGAHICEACAETCATTLRTERQLSEGRSSARPSPLTDDVHLGQVQPWSDFDVDGKHHQWRADRELVFNEKPLLTLEVRSERKLLDSVDIMRTEKCDQAYAKRVVERLAKRATQSIAMRSEASEWETFAVGSKLYEFRTVPVIRHSLERCLQVSVRAPEAAQSSSMMLPPDMTPTVDDAVMAASAVAPGMHPAAIEVESPPS